MVAYRGFIASLVSRYKRKRRIMPTEMRVFPAGTMARCNRCTTASAMPKESAGIRENERSFRLQTMMVLGCGHVDAHWVYVVDVDKEKYLQYLDDLREGGAVNMFGAVPCLMEAFPNLNRWAAGSILAEWMKTFSQRHPTKETA
jgi:hypothetical protein